MTADVLLFGLLWVDSFAATRIAVAFAIEGGHGVGSGQENSGYLMLSDALVA